MRKIETKKAPGAIGPYSQAFETNGFVITSGHPEILQSAAFYFHPVAKRTCHHILPRLSAGISIHIRSSF